MPIANCAELQQTIQFQSCANILLPQTGAQAKQQQQHTDTHTQSCSDAQRCICTHTPNTHTHSTHTHLIHTPRVRYAAAAN